MTAGGYSSVERLFVMLPNSIVASLVERINALYRPTELSVYCYSAVSERVNYAYHPHHASTAATFLFSVCLRRCLIANIFVTDR